MKRMLTGLASRSCVLPEDDQRQVLRLRRFLMALVTYIFSSLLFLTYTLTGAMSHNGYLWVTLLTVAVNLGFFFAFRSGLNLRFTDASLTVPQILAATGVLLLASYYVDEGRGALLLLYVVIFLFGVFRLSTRQFIGLSAVTLLAYVGVLFMLWLARPEVVQPRQELLQLLALAILLPNFALVAGNVSRLRERLSEANRELGEAMKQIQALVIRDDLTQQYNRRHMMTLLEDERARAVRTGCRFCVLMFDLDDFKAVNDACGHVQGDAVIRDVVRIVSHELRGTDRLGRYGGEEFLVLLPGLTEEEGCRVGERLCARVAEECRRPGGAEQPQTISVGVAEFRSPETVMALLDRVDRAMYVAKAGGRNRVCSAVAAEEEAGNALA